MTDSDSPYHRRIFETEARIAELSRELATWIPCNSEEATRYDRLRSELTVQQQELAVRIRFMEHADRAMRAMVQNAP
jgi:hypothetical protein